MGSPVSFNFYRMISVRDYNKGGWVPQAKRPAEKCRKCQETAQKPALVNGALLELAQPQPGKQQRKTEQSAIN
jgi:hypothetical protein